MSFLTGLDFIYDSRQLGACTLRPKKTPSGRIEIICVTNGDYEIHRLLWSGTIHDYSHNEGFFWPRFRCCKVINVFNSCLIVFLRPSKINIWILESDPPIQSHTWRKKIKTHKKWDLCLMCVVQDPKIFETIVLIYMYTLLIFLSYILKTFFCRDLWSWLTLIPTERLSFLIGQYYNFSRI